MDQREGNPTKTFAEFLRIGINLGDLTFDSVFDGQRGSTYSRVSVQ